MEDFKKFYIFLQQIVKFKLKISSIKFRLIFRMVNKL